MSVLNALLASVQSQYWRDTVKAGVVLSNLGSRDFYASVCRYPNGPNDKQIVCKAKGSTLDETVRALAVAWMIETRRFEALRIKTKLLPRDFDRFLNAALRP
jgi:hypothetical protein